MIYRVGDFEISSLDHNDAAETPVPIVAVLLVHVEKDREFVIEKLMNCVPRNWGK